MAFNGSGMFNRLYNWVNDAANGINILAARMDGEMDGMATALSDCVTRDGQSPPTANLPMGTFRHTGVGDGVAATDYASVGQVQTSLPAWIAGGGAADAITATYVPAVMTLTDGMLLGFRATAANATTTPTFSPNGLTARTIVKNGGAALNIGDITANLAEYLLRYNAANTRWELLNPFITTSGTWTPAVGGSATYTTQIGQYVKVGSLIHVKMDLQINAIGTGSATIVSGLPFAATAGRHSLAVDFFSTSNTSLTWLGAYVINGTTIQFTGTAAATPNASDVVSVFTSSTRVSLGGTYNI